MICDFEAAVGDSGSQFFSSSFAGRLQFTLNFNQKKKVPRIQYKFTMSVDVFLLINLLALFHRTTALPARIPSPGRAPRPSCVIPKPRVPKPHSCFLTDPDSICLPTSVLTVPLGLLYSAIVPKGALSIRDQHKPPKPLVSILGSNWRGAQARWFNVHVDNSALF